ncbi:hypothetical protein PR202_ga21465 [Eleusine coracana subsp. coracana]|uniref:Uncharacterized protein n=1 Tax=Eleusine coracana subsp. coracana TaxID=191504 RepID=A0AAV5CZQ8_ELECO|nr:hypothetical protein PR202_ga21465 [Eleusine coracana subsp. coracana]
MAARFLFQKFPSRMSGSKRLLRSCESASASAGAQVTHAASESSIRTLTDLSNGAAVHPWTAVSNNGGIRACAFVDSVGGEKRAFSSDVCTRNRISRKAKMATWAAEWDANQLLGKLNRPLGGLK